MKKIVSFALALLLVVAMVPVAVLAETTTPYADNLNEDAIIVTSEDDFKDADPTASYVLANNITITSPLFATDSFTGSFDGNGHVVTLENVNGMFEKSIGAEAYLANFTIEGSISKNSNNIGALTATGKVFGGTYYGITNKVAINPANARAYVGGLVASIETKAEGDITFTNCVNFGAVNGTSYVGGILGHAGAIDDREVTLTLQGCKNYGAIKGTGSCAGGILGSPAGNAASDITAYLIDCHNHGTINGAAYAGGIVGGIYNSGALATKDNTVNLNVTGCTNNAPVNGTQGVGGIVGWTRNSFSVALKVYDCVNNGEIIVDGASGYFVGGIVAGCLNIKGDGGILSLEIDKCINTAKVSANYSGRQSVYSTGGILGGVYECANSTVKLTSCVNLGDLDVSNQVASGILGLAGAEPGYTVTLENCYNVGSVSTNSSYYAPTEFVVIHSAEDATVSVVNCYTTGSNDLCNGVNDLDETVMKVSPADLAAKANAALDSCFSVSGDKVVYSAAHNYGETTLSTECSVCGDKGGYAGYVQTKEDGENTLVRFVMVVSDEELENATYTDFTMTVTVNGKTYTQKASELDSYDSVTAAGDTFTAADDHVLFGVVVDLGDAALTGASVVITAGDVTLYSGSI